MTAEAKPQKAEEKPKIPGPHSQPKVPTPAPPPQLVKVPSEPSWSATSTTPKFITGSCECRSVRYKLSFTPQFPFPPRGSTCHCTQCRKSLGGFLAVLLKAPLPNFEWIEKGTYREYPSSEHVRRGFCANCGGSVTFRYVNEVPNGLRVTGATVDKEFLDQGALGGCAASWWCGNYVKGIDDGMCDKLAGPRYIEEGPKTVDGKSIPVPEG